LNKSAFALFLIVALSVWALMHAYVFMAGCYDVAGMTLIMSRGAGTWGPRMRLWRRGEILRIKLRCAT
jgi:hypothetical protein